MELSFSFLVGVAPDDGADPAGEPGITEIGLTLAVGMPGSPGLSGVNLHWGEIPFKGGISLSDFQATNNPIPDCPRNESKVTEFGWVAKGFEKRVLNQTGGACPIPRLGQRVDIS